MNKFENIVYSKIENNTSNSLKDEVSALDRVKSYRILAINSAKIRSSVAKKDKSVVLPSDTKIKFFR